MSLFTSTTDTVFGPFSIAVDEDGALVATAFGTTEVLRGRLRGPAAELVTDVRRTRGAVAQIAEYSSGARMSFDLPLRPQGSAFELRVWAELLRIPPGGTCTYGDLARTLATAPRAVGRANGRNPLCLFIPCHRVIGRDGQLTGFAFGTPVKQRLLAHERSFMTRANALCS